MPVRRFLCLVGVAIAFGASALALAQPHSVKPKDGFVPDEQTAISIAIAIWEPIYGKEEIARQRPYRAVLSNGIWTVTGTLAKEAAGGVAFAEIAQADARVMRVSHGR